MRAYRLCALAALALAFVVIVVGAYVRLADAGLGCPDWPLCYGRVLPGEIADSDALAKAWKEMAHRYLVGVLGLLIVLLAVFGWKTRRSPWLATAIVALVAFQATLGKWTVTMLLKPAIVTAHLLGGMATLALLIWLALTLWPDAPFPDAKRLRAAAVSALAAVALQIALGGWVSANYAALACPDLPLCMGELVPKMDFGSAFHVVRELGLTGEGRLLPREALTAIHWSHRMFALVVLAVVAWAGWRTFETRPLLGGAIVLLVLVQFSLGVANVAAGLPLALAAAHNAGAALLLCSLVVLNFFAWRGH